MVESRKKILLFFCGILLFQGNVLMRKVRDMEERLREILKVAQQYDVSDIHFDITDNQIRIEMRVQQQMRQLIPQKDDIRLFQYLMYQANLDVSDSIRPQSGSFQFSMNHSTLSLRFSVVSSYHMKSGVLRILNNHSSITLSSLTTDENTLTYLSSITKQMSGLYLFSGPTGSGKTTTLYTILNETQGKKIFSLEDPVEVVNEKYVQIQINEKQHMSYAEGIRQLMRHDPDIIMIGEIRDEEVAKMAVRCALTGHLVLSSIHSFSCESTIVRMLELGVEKYQLKEVLKGVSCQRLFDRGKEGKTGIYEIMNEEEIAFYFSKGELRDDFETLQKKVRKAFEKHILSFEQAKEYFES